MPNRNRPNYSSRLAVRSRLKWPMVFAIGFLIIAGFLLGSVLRVKAASVEDGYRDFSFGSTGLSSPTGEKPESKLWWNDGFWWGSLYNNTAQEFHIYRLDLAAQTWADTGTSLDDRNTAKGDALWDNANQKLYLVSHIMVDVGVPSSDPSEWGRLYRYSYHPSTHTYSLDAGFPVNVTQGKSETLTIARDSTGRLWVTYVESDKVMINHSTTSDTVWGVPFALPFADAVNVKSDDISAIIAFQGNKIGVMWSNQNDKKMHFAVHLDGAGDTTWQAEETALPGPGCTGSCADDHINLKSVQVDGTGRVFAAVKTSLSQSNAPLIMLLVRSVNGTWNSNVFGRVVDGHTRPLVLLDEEHGRIHMFATASGVIYYKSTDINNIQFPSGLGTPFIQSSVDININNATSTKQNVNSATGLIVLASDSGSKYYLHNYLSLGGSGATATPTDTPTPTNTPTPTDTPDPNATPTSTPPPTDTPMPTDTPDPNATPTDTPTPTNTPSASDLIFADSFESGNFAAWSSASTGGGDLSVTTSAALVGSNGTQAVINDTTAMFANDTTPDAEPRYRARFYFDPNSISMAEGDMHTLFYGFSGSTSVLRVDFRRSGGAYQLMARALDDGSTWSATPWFTISDAPHAIEFDWQASSAVGANTGSLAFWLDGGLDGGPQASLTGIDNDTRRMDTVHVGVVTGLDAGTSGTEYFDAFESRRQTYIGP